MNMNQYSCAGHLGVDAKSFASTGGTIVSLFLLVNDSYTDKAGNRVESTTPLTVKVFGRWAETAATFKKGDNVFVTGKLQENKWKDEASGKERSTLEVRATSLGRIQKEARGTASEDAKAGKKSTQSSDSFDIQEVPF